jgi:hypothetical protein
MCQWTRHRNPVTLWSGPRILCMEFGVVGGRPFRLMAGRPQPQGGATKAGASARATADAAHHANPNNSRVGSPPASPPAGAPGDGASKRGVRAKRLPPGLLPIRGLPDTNVGTRRASLKRAKAKAAGVYLDRCRPNARIEGAGQRRLGDREGPQDRPGVGLSGVGSRLMRFARLVPQPGHNTSSPSVPDYQACADRFRAGSIREPNTPDRPLPAW